MAVLQITEITAELEQDVGQSTLTITAQGPGIVGVVTATLEITTGSLSVTQVTIAFPRTTAPSRSRLMEPIGPRTSMPLVLRSEPSAARTMRPTTERVRSMEPQP
jgi:hypothetical protein